jgi:arsenate reductase (thioredoxin)
MLFWRRRFVNPSEGGKVIIKFRGKSEKPAERTILFVCVENAGRSQIAEGFFNQKYAPKGYSAISAGTRPASQINPLAIQAMNEVGIDISSQKSKIITEDMIRSSTKSVNMGCIERAECPLLFINNVIDWGIEDPKGKPIEKVREIRDEIDRRVREIAQSLQGQNSS